MGGTGVRRPPLTVGTAGHIDHGKTALVAALTGRDTDRLPDEKRRGISIELGYAPLDLPSGRRVSVVDVPGHERLVRTMVAGASGIDFFLMTVAADDGVMPQTREHAAVLEALGVTRGVVAITKADAADPARARAEVAELLPGRPAVAVSARTREGLDALRTEIERVASDVASRADRGGPVVLHVDRAFTIKGAGTVVTGTLWSGVVAQGDGLVLLPAGRRVRVRSVQVHDDPTDRAEAGQRVALNLAGVGRDEVARGDVLTDSAGLEPSYRIDAELHLSEDVTGTRVQVHHGTRESPARVVARGGHAQLRLERPLLARPGDRLVVRRIAPPDTLGGGVVLARPARVEPASPAAPASRPRPTISSAVEEKLRTAGHEPPPLACLTDEERADLPALRDAGRIVRAGPQLHFHADAIADARARVERICTVRGTVTVADLRDELATSRRYAQALLEHLDSTRVTRREGDARVLRRRPDTSRKG